MLTHVPPGPVTQGSDISPGLSLQGQQAWQPPVEQSNGGQVPTGLQALEGPPFTLSLWTVGAFSSCKQNKGGLTGGGPRDWLGGPSVNLGICFSRGQTVEASRRPGKPPVDLIILFG